MDTVNDLNATACGFPKLYQRDNLVSQEVVLQIEKETASAAAVCSTGSLFPELDSISVAASVIQTCCPGTKARDLEEDDKFYEDFNMDEVDLNIENYEETFGVALNDPEQLFGNDGIGSLFGVKDMSGADLNHRGTYAAESVRLPPLGDNETCHSVPIFDCSLPPRCEFMEIHELGKLKWSSSGAILFINQENLLTAQIFWKVKDFWNLDANYNEQ
ncbi:hypothetical protein TEA_011188 [Camellia sinensis var. sinensis]|uniref:Uncharacterized protein n=1 Tax=Camellia sinensis var. sinensis TaxID=542762 RepID=A0A4S4E646_CAMSN|nr:hypothetical protein TEA_011188 [Camellia sinensis var. sinensis]